MIEHVKTLEDYKLAMDEAWQQVERVTRPSGGVRNCPSDLQDEDFALRKYQNAKHQYLEFCKMEGIEP
jgi:hypothetical protein